MGCQLSRDHLTCISSTKMLFRNMSYCYITKIFSVRHKYLWKYFHLYSIAINNTLWIDCTHTCTDEYNFLWDKSFSRYLINKMEGIYCRWKCQGHFQLHYSLLLVLLCKKGKSSYLMAYIWGCIRYTWAKW